MGIDRRRDKKMSAGPSPDDLCRLGAVEAAELIAAHIISSRALVAACLDRIATREDDVRAWVHLDGEQALNQADARDAEAPRGPLHGVPVAVKDVIDTADMPTAYGSSIYAGHRPRADAAAVAFLRAAGLVVLGKTVATELGHRTPGKTRNPVDLRHTPGGSSSGSAAAVADRMVPLAIGTQTGGSVIRPASYCGTVGYKPTFGLVSCGGAKSLSPSFDTIGLFARSVADAAALTSIIIGDRADVTPAPHGQLISIGICRTATWDEASDGCRAAIDQTADRLADAGAAVTLFDLPSIFNAAPAAYRLVNGYETWRALAFEREAHGDTLSAPLCAMLDEGSRVSRTAYADALGTVAECRRRFNDALGDCDLLLTPSAAGEAPLGHADIGASTFNSLWTLVGAPCLTLPLNRDQGELPLGVQLVGRRFQDEPLLALAGWVEKKISHELCS